MMSMSEMADEEHNDNNMISFMKMRRLGKGSFGTVHLAQSNILSHPRIAVKSCLLHSSQFHSFKRELAVLQHLRGCPEIVGCLGYKVCADTPFQEEEEVLRFNLLLEYASAGTLSDLIIEGGGRLSEPEIKCFTRMLLNGLRTLHANGLVHCDFKPKNILAFPPADGAGGPTQLKIADFGLAMSIGEAFTVKRFIGTPLYMSPETVATAGLVSPALDIWSLGCVVVEMFTGKPAMDRGHDRAQVALDLKSLKNPVRELIPKTMSMAGRDFLSKCFDLDAGNRWSAYELLQHPFIWGININNNNNCHKMITTPSPGTSYSCPILID